MRAQFDENFIVKTLEAESPADTQLLIEIIARGMRGMKPGKAKKTKSTTAGNIIKAINPGNCQFCGLHMGNLNSHVWRCKQNPNPGKKRAYTKGEDGRTISSNGVVLGRPRKIEIQSEPVPVV